MKMYFSMQEALKAIFYRADKQVIAIINLNNKGYFVCRSTPSPQQSLVIATSLKLQIKNELSHQKKQPRDQNAFVKLQTFIENVATLSDRKNEPTHAEEKIILNFKVFIELFASHFPEEKISVIDLYLTHSPCKTVSHNTFFSSAKNINGIEYDTGCYEKLIQFFNEDYRIVADPIHFAENVKINGYYIFAYNNQKYDKHFIPLNDQGIANPMKEKLRLKCN